MARLLISSLVIYCLVCDYASGQTKSKAQLTTQKTTGSCASIINENHGTITLSCPSLAPEQFRQLSALLQGIGHTQSATRDILLRKMQELLVASEKSKSTEVLNAPNGVIQVGDHNLASVTNLGPQPLTLTDEQLKAIALAMQPFRGRKIRLEFETSPPSTVQTGIRLKTVLEQSGIIIDTMMAMSIGTEFGIKPQPGIAFAFHNPDRAMILAFAKALIDSGFPVPSGGFQAKQMPEGSISPTAIILGPSL